jgi:tetratricopeptide (TPR) repeat protein
MGVFGLESAEGDLREALRIEPDDPAIRQNLAVLLVERSVREMDPERARTLRDEARSLDPELAQLGEGARPDIDRRLDLAFELLQRGQIDAAIERLEALHTAHPDHPETTRLLAQALVRKAIQRADRGRHHEAGPLLDRAVGLYADVSSTNEYTTDHPEFHEELRVVHRSRVVAWMNASRPEAARQALADAERAGFRFPDLERAVH